jgi:hypothetical protein
MNCVTQRWVCLLLVLLGRCVDQRGCASGRRRRITMSAVSAPKKTAFSCDGPLMVTFCLVGVLKQASQHASNRPHSLPNVSTEA